MKRLASAAAVLLVFAVVPAALAAATLSGKFQTKISGDKALGGALNGTWVFTAKKATYSVTQNGKLVVKGKDTITASTITLKDTGGPGKCSGTGVYKYKLKGKHLSFTKVSDPAASCVGRVDVLKHKFTKVS